MNRFGLLVLCVLSLFLSSCEEPVDTFVEEPANNLGPCWECDQLPSFNLGNNVLLATTYWGVESYFETFYNYSNGRYLGWVELDYATGDSISEEYVYNVDDLIAVISYDGTETVIDSVRTIATTDTNYVFFQTFEYRFANAENDELPNVVIEYYDNDYIMNISDLIS